MSQGDADHLASTLLAAKGGALPSTFGPDRRLRADDVATPPAIQFPLLAHRGKQRLGLGSRRDNRVKASVKLDRDTHQRLRLASTLLRKSMQDILVEALDRHLDEVALQVCDATCDCLSSPFDLKRKSARE